MKKPTSIKLGDILTPHPRNVTSLSDIKYDICIGKDSFQRELIIGRRIPGLLQRRGRANPFTQLHRCNNRKIILRLAGAEIVLSIQFQVTTLVYDIVNS